MLHRKWCCKVKKFPENSRIYRVFSSRKLYIAGITKGMYVQFVLHFYVAYFEVPCCLSPLQISSKVQGCSLLTKCPPNGVFAGRTLTYKGDLTTYRDHPQKDRVFAQFNFGSTAHPSSPPPWLDFWGFGRRLSWRAPHEKTLTMFIFQNNYKKQISFETEVWRFLPKWLPMDMSYWSHWTISWYLLVGDHSRQRCADWVCVAAVSRFASAFLGLYCATEYDLVNSERKEFCHLFCLLCTLGDLGYYPPPRNPTVGGSWLNLMTSPSSSTPPQAPAFPRRPNLIWRWQPPSGDGLSRLWQVKWPNWRTKVMAVRNRTTVVGITRGQRAWCLQICQLQFYGKSVRYLLGGPCVQQCAAPNRPPPPGGFLVWLAWPATLPHLHLPLPCQTPFSWFSSAMCFFLFEVGGAHRFFSQCLKV